MSILNVNQIQPVGGGNTITVSANDVNFSGNISIGSSFVGTATTASLATSAQGLTGTPDITVGNIQSGVVTATTFIGDGSGLTGVTASGSGINIKDSGSTVGVAATVDFSTNLNVSPASAGIVTVTVGDTDFSIADKIVHTGDTNTAIRFPSDDTVTVETAGSEALRITSNNKIGIDSTSPHRQLVVGDGGDISCFGTNGGIYFGTDTGGFRNNGAIARAQQNNYHVSGSQVGDLVMAPEADKDLIFSSGSTNTMYERLRITTGGVLSIGENDPSPLGGEYRGMDVGYKGSGISGRTGNPTFTLRSNIYYDGSNWKYGEGNTTAGVLSIGGAQLIFEAAASGTAGATATILERLRVDSSGRVLIGRTSTQNENIAGTGYANIVQIEGDATGEGLTVANSAAAARINITRDLASDSITNGMDLGFISFGSESPTSVERARIQCDAEFTNANERGGNLKFYTSADGSFTPTEKVRITSGGDLGLGVSGGMNQAGTLYIQGGQGVRWTHTSDGTLYGDYYVSASGQHVFRSGSSLTERLRLTPEGYPWIQNKKTTSFTNNNTVTILTIGSHNNTVVKFMVQASDTGYRQNEWAGEYTAFVSDANGSPGVSYYLKEHWQDFGSGNWNSPVVTVSINSSGQVQFNATNSNSDANGSVHVFVLSVTSISSTIPTIS